jgi:hypothetical protein
MRAFFRHDHWNPAAGRRLFVWPGLILALLCVSGVRADPPIITADLTPKIAESGTTVTFSVTAVQSNTPSALSFLWRRNGVNIPGTLTNIFTNTATAAYTITNVQPMDGGAYSVVVFNDDGAVKSAVAGLIVTNTLLIPGSDSFADRYYNPLPIPGGQAPTQSIRASNVGATIEPGEPRHGNVPGGASVWFTWSPTQSGVYVIDTRGSDFDTTLGVYEDPGSTVTNVSGLLNSLFVPLENDDAGIPNNYHNSLVAFNVIVSVVAGSNYAIAVDGFYGVTGNIVLNITKQPMAGNLPAIVRQPQSQTVPFGATFTPSFNSDTNGFSSYQWYRNGVSITGTNPVAAGTTDASLTISNVSAAEVGQYQALVMIGNNAIFTDPASLQIDYQDGEFNASAVALPKFRAATDRGFATHSKIHPNAVPVSGYTGTHIWNTYGAEAEPGEPNHCGKVGGAPYWFSYLAPASGTLTVDACTPTFTNVLAIYTGPGDSYDTLVPMACASTNQGVGHEVAVCLATNGAPCWIVVDGLDGAVGDVTLSYNLAAPPVITSQPQSQTVPQGSNVTVSVSATGAIPLSYQWRTNALKLSGETSFSLSLTNFQATNQGNYDVVVTNMSGAATSAVAMLYLNSPLRFGSTTFSPTGGFAAFLLGMASSNYVFQASTNLATTNWIPILTNSSPYGIMSFVDTNLQSYTNRFFRAVVKTN